MKTLHGNESHLLCATMPHGLVRYRGSEDLAKTLTTAAAWGAGVTLVIALYVVMFLALYRWSQYAPLYPPDAFMAPAMEEVLGAAPRV